MDVSREHGLIAVGTEDGTVECFDSRTREAVGTLRVTKAGHEGLGQGVTALKHDPTGMHLAAGDHDGIVRLYDLRLRGRSSRRTTCTARPSWTSSTTPRWTARGA